MTPEARKRLDEIRERVGNPGSAVHSLPATAMDMKFLLRVIDDLAELRLFLSRFVETDGRTAKEIIAYMEAWLDRNVDGG